MYEGRGGEGRGGERRGGEGREGEGRGGWGGIGHRKWRDGRRKGRVQCSHFQIGNDEVSACPGMGLFHGHHLHSLRKVGLSAFFVGRMVMR